MTFSDVKHVRRANKTFPCGKTFEGESREIYSSMNEFSMYNESHYKLPRSGIHQLKAAMRRGLVSAS